MCLARFDDDTKEAFLSLYGKVDAEANMDEAASDAVNPEGVDTKCPF
jgi:hypothetical protein